MPKSKKLKIEYVSPPPERRTMEFSEWKRLMVSNSKNAPTYVSVGGIRRCWVGIGTIDEGPEHGDEIIIVENGLMPVVEKGNELKRSRNSQKRG